MAKNILLILTIQFSFCLSIYAGINCQLSGGMNIYGEAVGFNANISVHYPLKLLNRNNEDFNPGIILSGSYADSGELNILNYGPGIDLGYIISLNGFHIIPSAGIGYLWGNAVIDELSIDINGLYVYPHLMLSISLNPSVDFGLDAGYRTIYINNKDSSLHDSINSFVLNLTVSIYNSGNNKPSSQTASHISEAVTNTSYDNTDSEEKVIKNTKSLVSSGNKKKAIELLESFLKKNPDNKKVKEMLILLRSSNIDIEK